MLYDSFSWAYDLVAWVVSFGFWPRWRLVSLDYLKTGSVLETGFGTGALLFALTARGQDVTGLELSPAMQRVTSRKLKCRGVTVKRIQSRTEAIPFPDGSFTNVLSTFPSRYIASEQTIREVGRVLDDGGRWVIMGLNAAFTTGLRRWLTAWLFHEAGGEKIKQFIQKVESLGLKAEILTHQAPEYSLEILILEKKHD